MQLSSPTNGRTEPRPIVFSDFDGTITQVDVTDAILAKLADPAWREIETEWVRGDIGSRECLARQIALVRAGRQELDALIDTIPVDPGFAAFYRFTHQRGLPFYIVSDGFDYVIRRILKRAGVDGGLRNGSHLFASRLRVQGRRLLPSFGHPAAGCEHGCATCKARLIRRIARGAKLVTFIGDGLSDRFAVHQADLVFAKSQLLEYCREQGVTAEPFETFVEIEAGLSRLLGEASARVESKRAHRRSQVRSRKAEVLAV